MNDLSQKQLITSYLKTFNLLTHSFPKHAFSTPLKHQKSLRFSDIFREQRKGALGTNGLTTNVCLMWKYVDSFPCKSTNWFLSIVFGSIAPIKENITTVQNLEYCLNSAVLLRFMQT